MHEFVGNTLVPSEVMDSDICVNQAYPNLRVAFQPAEQRTETGAGLPFALVDQIGGFIIKELSVEMAKNTPFLLRWLYENDANRHGEKSLYNKMIESNVKLEAEKKQIASDRLAERAEVAHSIASSPLHSYRINGQKVGSDNEMPYLGLWDK